MRKSGLVLRALCRASILASVTCSSPLFAQSSAKNCSLPVELQSAIAAHPDASSYLALGSYFGDHGEFACAIPAFQKSLRLDTASAQAHLYLGLAYLATGDPAQAAVELRQSLRYNDQQPQARLALGAALRQIEQTDQAIAEFRTVLAADPRSIAALEQLAQAYLSQQRYATAIALLQAAPPNESLQLHLAAAYSGKGDRQSAINVLTATAAQFPSSTAPHAELGKLYTLSAQYEQASREFDTALTLDPKNDEARLSYAKTLMLMSEFAAAQPLVTAYRAQHPDDFDSLYLSGVIARQLGELDAARTVLEKAAARKPNDFGVRYNLGLLYARLGDPAKAREQLEQAIAINPSAREAHFQLSAILRQLSLTDEARLEMATYQHETAESAQHELAVARATQGRALLQRGQVQPALELFAQAVAADPHDTHILYDYALASDRIADYPRERATLEQLLAIDPRDAAAHNELGLVLEELNDTAGAEREFQSAIALSPHSVEALNNLGALYGREDLHPKAESLFRRAIESDPEYSRSYANLAAALAEQSRFTEARAAIATALRLDSQNSDALRLKSMLDQQLGHSAPPN